MWCRVPLALAALASVCSGVARAHVGLDELLGRDLWNALDAENAAPQVASRVQMLVLDLTPMEEEEDQEGMSMQDRQRACEAGVAQLQEQWAMRQELAQMRHRLRDSGARHGYEHLSVVQLGATATCDDLERAEMVDECERVVKMEKVLRPMVRHGKMTKTQICAAVYKQDPPPPSPEPLSCKLCKRFLQMVLQAVKKDFEQIEDVRAILGDICDEMAADSMCHTFLQHFDDIVDWIKEGTDPAYVCPYIHMCPAGKHGEAPGALVAAMDDKHCWFCDEVTTVLEILMQEQPGKIDVIREYADMICQMLGDDSPCHQYEKEFDYVVDALKQHKTPRDICKELKYCKAEARAISSPLEMAATDSSPSKAVATLTAQSFHSCFYCVHVTGVVRFALESYPKLVEPIRQLLEQACKLAPKDCKCDEYVKDYDKVVSMIKKGKEPLEVCEDIHMCKKKETNDRTTLLDLMMSDHVAEEVAALVVPSESFSPIPELTCFNCHYFTTMVEILMQERPQILDEIREFADMICGLLGDDSNCHKYMKQLDFIVDELEKGKRPPEICVTLKYCKKTVAPPSKSFSRLDRKENALEASLPQTAGETCFYCKLLGRFLKIAIEQYPAEVDQIRQVAQLICSILPAENECHSLVRSMDKMIDSIKGGEDPAAVCHDLKYCPKPPADDSLVPLLPKPSLGSNKCAYCDGILTVLKYAIQEKPEIMDELREAAGVVCELLPEDDECHNELKTFDKAVEELNEGKAPHVICKDLKFCPASTAAPSLYDLMNVETAKTAEMGTETSMSVGCLFCEYTAVILKHIHLDSKQLMRAKKVLESMCTVLPPSARCDVLTAQFDSIAKMVHEGKSPSQACNKVGLCTAKWVKDEDQEDSTDDQEAFHPFGNLADVQ